MKTLLNGHFPGFHPFFVLKRKRERENQDFLCLYPGSHQTSFGKKCEPFGTAESVREEVEA